MSLSPSDLRRIKDAFNEAANAPGSDTPLLAAGGRTLSVRDIADEIESETDIGKALIRGFETAIDAGLLTVDDIVEMSKQPPSPPKP